MKNKKAILTTVVAIIALIAFLFFGKGCKDFPFANVGGIQTDTVYTTVTKTDTLWKRETVFLNAPFPVVDTFYSYIDTSDSLKPVETVSVYSGEAKDSIVAISYSLHTTGKLIKAPELNYTLLQPYLIRDTIETIKIITNTVFTPTTTRTGGIYLGVKYGFNEQTGRKAFGTEFLVVGKKFGLAYSYDYDFINQVHSFGIKKRLHTIR